VWPVNRHRLLEVGLIAAGDRLKVSPGSAAAATRARLSWWRCASLPNAGSWPSWPGCYPVPLGRLPPRPWHVF